MDQHLTNVKTLLGWSAQWAVFLLLWLLFVYQVSSSELLAGAGAAALTVLALRVSLHCEPLCFQPRLAELVQAWRLPSLVLADFRILFRVLVRRLSGKPVSGVFQQTHFHALGRDPREGAKRSLAILFLSLSPNSIVAGIEEDSGLLLLHQLLPTPVPALKRKLEE